MLRVLAAIFLLTIHLNAISQPSNQWINFSQEYYKIPVAKDGVYRISYLTLQEAGFPVSGDPQFFQLIHRGVEQAILVNDDTDNQFNPEDYILFYGRKNDGTLDKQLYESPDGQPHNYYNLFSDTTSYFLTIGPLAGKRMSHFIGDNSDGLEPESSHHAEHLLVLTEQYNPARSLRNEVFTSTFDPNESWTSITVRDGTVRDFEISGINHMVTGDGPPEVEIEIMGRSPFFHNAEIYIGQSLRLLKTVSFSLFERVIIKEQINWSDISADGKLTVRLKVLSNGYLDQISLSYARLVYPQEYDAGSAEKIFQTRPSAGDQIYIEIQAPPSSAGVIYDVTDPANVIAIGTSGTSTLNAVVPNATTSRKLFLTGTTLVPANIRKVRFKPLVPGVHDYIIITHPVLRKPSGAYADPVKAFAAYRASAEGGGFDTLIVHTPDLYDQFNYGEPSPLAVRRFLEYISVPNSPRYLFLLGKGLEHYYGFYRQANRSTWTYQDLVPTGGYPGSDAIFSAGLNGATHEEGIPTGRLSATKPEQVATYLDKVREMESSPDNALWKKNIIHLSGGVEEGEPEQFRSILESYADIAQGPYLGAKVTALAKKSRDLEVVNVSDQVNSGVAMITFFGHSSPNGFDFDLGFVHEPVLGYRNKGKYPVLLMNGCEAGAFFLTDTIFAENWVYAKNKGAIAFIAHNSYASASVLEEYSRRFYEVAFGDSAFFGRGLGDIHKETAKRHLAESQASIANLSMIQQMILLGDPALRIFKSRKPDVALNEEQISVTPFNGSYVNALSDSFAIKMIVSNFGMARGDTFSIQVEQVLEDNTSIFYDSLFGMPDYADTIYFVIRKGVQNFAGTNTFHITLDPDNVIDELDENNNNATHTLLIPRNGTKNLFPAEFSILHNNDVRFSFQATDAFSDRRTFVLQVDTLNSFGSPFMKEFNVDAKVLATHTVTLLEMDSLAYYWRTRLKDPLPGETSEWTESSFSFIAGSPDGWAQLHFPQLLDNATIGLVKNEGSRQLEFENSITPVVVTTWGASAGKEPKDVSVKIDGAEYNLFVLNNLFKCRTNTINFIAFDKNSTSPYAGIYLKWYEQWGQPVNACGREPVVINSFAANEVNNNGTRDVIEYVNNIAEGDSVLMFNIGNPSVHLWDAVVRTKLGELGISNDQLNQVGNGEPVVIFGRKGSPPGTARLYISDSDNPSTAELRVNETVTGAFDSGTLSSPRIGPAMDWAEIVFQSTVDEARDELTVDVIGIRLNGSMENLFEDISTRHDLSSVDANEYPYLQLRFNTADTVLLTPAQLGKWIVHFTPAPEGVLIPDHPENPKFLNEGENWIDAYRFVNISEMTFPDSLSVNVRISNSTQLQTTSSAFRIRAPLPFDTTRFQVIQSTKGLSGTNDVQLYVNPREVPEQYYDNNIIQMNDYLVVSRDRYAPVIDVTFDGRYLLNEDHVSSNPEIRISIWDENTHLFKSDTSGIAVFLSYPCDDSNCPATNVWLRRPDMKWYPASTGEPFRIDFEPKDLQPGTYTLRVEASDASGNSTTPFSIRFNISDERKYTIIPLHPNPFNVQATFGFHLTTDGLPESLRLEVTDITGRILFMDSIIENFHVGRNEFQWNGHDKNGSILKPGVYPYRLLLTIEGATVIEQGKIVISR